MRKKRETADSELWVQNITENGTDILKSFNFTVQGKTEILINRLHHYSRYNINVEACRKVEGKEDTEPICSPKIMRPARTLEKGNY